MITLAKKLLNRASSNRIISKQECIVECLELPLTMCSEKITTVSISGSAQITTKKMGGNFLTQYANRAIDDENLSLCAFIHRILRKEGDDSIQVIHFVGMNNTPVFPVSPSYARATLIVNAPWRDAMYHAMSNQHCLQIFYERLRAKQFPSTVLLNYLQAKNRYEQSIRVKETIRHNNQVDNEVDSDGSTFSDTDEFIINHFTTLTSNNNNGEPEDIEDAIKFRGINYDWTTKKVTEVRQTI